MTDRAIVRQVSSRRHKITDTHIERLVSKANNPKPNEDKDKAIMYSLQAILRRAK